MTGRLEPGVPWRSAQFTATFAPLSDELVVSGEPRTRAVALDATAEREVGVWEHTPGVSRDVEADEVFVVLAGSGTLRFLEPERPDIELTPGTIVRLAEGMRTEWTIHETLRKVYLTP